MTYTLSNKSGLDVRSSTMGIHLPDHVTYTSSNSKPMGSRGALVDDTATWANGGAIKAGKSKTYTANMQVLRLFSFCLCAHALLSSLLPFTTPPSLFMLVAYSLLLFSPFR